MARWEDRLVVFLEDQERRARFLRIAWWISMAMVFLGFAVIFAVLAF